MRWGREMEIIKIEKTDIDDFFDNIGNLPLELQERINLFLSNLDERRKSLER